MALPTLFWVAAMFGTPVWPPLKVKKPRGPPWSCVCSR